MKYMKRFLVGLSALVLAGSLNTLSVKADSDAIADGVWLGNVDLSGKTLSEAGKAMEDYFDELQKKDLTIYIYEAAEPDPDESDEAEESDEPGKSIADEIKENAHGGRRPESDEFSGEPLYTVSIPMSKIGLEWSVDDSLRQATSIGQSGKLVERYKILQDMKYSHAQLPLQFSVDEQSISEYVREVLAPSIDQEPINAEATLWNGAISVTKEDQPGISLDLTRTIDAIFYTFSEGIPSDLSCKTTAVFRQADVRASELRKINKKMGEMSTRFDRAEADRSANLDLACELVNGTIVLPGETLSVDQALGPRVPERGWHKGGSFDNGGIVETYGGGICQFSTTLYNAALFAEMEILVRSNHSMVVAYVPYSRDAAIDAGNKDMIFRNNTDAPIYIECFTWELHNITCRIYGHDTRPANRKVEFETTTEKEVIPSPRYVITNSAPGPATCDGYIHNEVTSYVTKHVYVDGVLQQNEEKKMNEDYYRPSQQTVTVGGAGLGLKVVYSPDWLHQKVVDANGEELLINSYGVPFYNNQGGYLLKKYYRTDANGFAVMWGNWPAPRDDVQQPTATTAPPSTEAESTVPSSEDPNAVAVPNILGMTVSAAVTQLHAVGLKEDWTDIGGTMMSGMSGPADQAGNVVTAYYVVDKTVTPWALKSGNGAKVAPGSTVFMAYEPGATQPQTTQPPATTAPTQPPTQPSTEPPTQPSTEALTEPPTTAHVHNFSIRTVLQSNYKTTEEGDQIIYWDQVQYSCSCGTVDRVVDEENHREQKQTQPPETPAETQPPVSGVSIPGGILGADAATAKALLDGAGLTFDYYDAAVTEGTVSGMFIKTADTGWTFQAVSEGASVPAGTTIYLQFG